MWLMLINSTITFLNDKQNDNAKKFIWIVSSYIDDKKASKYGLNRKIEYSSETT